MEISPVPYFPYRPLSWSFCALSTSLIMQQFHGVELLEIPAAGSISKAASVQKELRHSLIIDFII